MSRVRLICFDLDETLVADNAAYEVALVRMRDSLNVSHPHLPAGDLVRRYRVIGQDYWTAREGTVVRSPSGASDGAAIRRELWLQALAEHDWHDPGLAGEVTDVFMRCRSETYLLFDDALPVLDKLRARGIALAAITNGPHDTQSDKVRRTGLEPYFDVVACSSAVGHAKPDPAIFRFVLDKLGVAPDAAWHIGDSLPNDVAGAIATGLTSVWINRDAAQRPGHHPTPHHEVAGLAELLALLG